MELFGTGFWTFILVTLFLGGGAAWMTGRAIALTWQSMAILVFYILLLAGAVRFIHFSLYGGELLSLIGYLRDAAVLLVVAFIAFNVTRRLQMRSQYGFLDA